MTLVSMFESLPPPAGPHAYAVEVDTGKRCRVGRSAEGYPALLISFKHEVGSTGFRLANLVYRPPAEVDVVGGTSTRARVAILECRSTDAMLIAYFFRVVGTLVIDDPRSEDEAQFAAALETIVQLFRGLQHPGNRTVQGLWAELAVILWSADPQTAIRAWHSDPHDLHDFSTGAMRLEVKSTTKKLRQHSFLLDQLTVAPGGATVIASLLLEEHDAATSLVDLVERIQERVGTVHELQKRLLVIVDEGLGLSWRDAGEIRFDLNAARGSLRFYHSNQIPSVQPPPLGVMDVRFTSDLSGSPMAELAEVRAIAAMYTHLLPPES
jgi:hypothetical protein